MSFKLIGFISLKKILIIIIVIIRGFDLKKRKRKRKKRGFDVLRGFLYTLKLFFFNFISSFTFSIGDLAVHDWYNLLFFFEKKMVQPT